MLSAGSTILRAVAMAGSICHPYSWARALCVSITDLSTAGDACDRSRQQHRSIDRERPVETIDTSLAVAVAQQRHAIDRCLRNRNDVKCASGSIVADPIVRSGA